MERTRVGEEQVYPLPRPQQRLQVEDVCSPAGQTLATSPSGYPEKSACEEGSLYATVDTDANNVPKV
jgi:hypothetical protein